MQTINYRGCELVIQPHGPGYKVFVRRGLFVDPDMPHSSDPDDLSLLIERAKAIVDRLIDNP
jgi:hypothetical protein